MRFVERMMKMKFWSWILLFGVSFAHWTTTSQFRHGNCLVDTEAGTLKSVNATSNSTKMDLSSLHIERIAENVFDQLTNVKYLNLSNNKLKELSPQIFSKLNNLEELLLANNEISSIKYDFEGLNHLKRLDISYTKIMDLWPGDLFGLAESAEIITEGSRFYSISPSVFQNELAFSDSVFSMDPECRYNFWRPRRTSMPSGLFFGDSNDKLCKSNDGLVRSVEEWKQNETIGDCKKVPIDSMVNTLCALDHRDLKKFQRGWYKLPRDSKRFLRLSHNSIRDITPELLNDLPSGLFFIDLSFNKIEIVRKNLIENRSCRKLVLASNSLSTIEDGAFRNTNLTFLSVRNNLLNNLVFVRTLPTSLTELDFSSNLFADISANTFRGLKNLQILDLSNNYLEKLEAGIFEDQENLLGLYLQGNEISELNSESFKGLKMLHLLVLDSNKIKKISYDTFSFFKNSYLWRLSLAENQIDSIEEGSFSHMNLTHLILSNNKIMDESISKGAFNGSALCFLDLDENLLTRSNDELFDSISKIYFLLLRGNQIVSMNISESLKNVRRLNLYNNPLKRLVNGGVYASAGTPSDNAKF